MTQIPNLARAGEVTPTGHFDADGMYVPNDPKLRTWMAEQADRDAAALARRTATEHARQVELGVWMATRVEALHLQGLRDVTCTRCNGHGRIPRPFGGPWDPWEPTLLCPSCGGDRCVQVPLP